MACCCGGGSRKLRAANWMAAWMFPCGVFCRLCLACNHRPEDDGRLSAIDQADGRPGSRVAGACRRPRESPHSHPTSSRCLLI